MDVDIGLGVGVDRRSTSILQQCDIEKKLLSALDTVVLPPQCMAEGDVFKVDDFFSNEVDFANKRYANYTESLKYYAYLKFHK